MVGWAGGRPEESGRRMSVSGPFWFWVAVWLPSCPAGSEKGREARRRWLRARGVKWQRHRRLEREWHPWALVWPCRKLERFILFSYLIPLKLTKLLSSSTLLFRKVEPA